MDRELRPAVVGGWLFASAVLCLALAGPIAGMRFPDPDDAMRLLQARDWLAGQGWFDVGQHRLDGGAFAMHWSRLVDLPIAAVLLVADRLADQPLADRIAMTLVPLVTLLAAMALVAAVTRRVAGLEAARLSVLLVPLSAPLLTQIRPMRIDHHGWQTVLALAAVALLLGRPTLRRGAGSGLMLAALVCVSLEGLPVAVAIVAAAALAWVARPERRAFLLGQAWAFAAAAAAIHVATRGPASLAPACDAVSPPWLLLLGVAAGGLTIATALPARGWRTRFAALAPGGIACLLTIRLAAPDCLAGPFATLDPLVRDLWYRSIPEGLPIWDQSPSWAAASIGLPLLGLWGGWRAARHAEGDRADRWLLLGVLAAATLVSVFVNRGAATANALAIPGAAAVALRLLARARAVPNMLGRTVATAGALVVASPGAAAGALLSAADTRTLQEHAVATRGPARPYCRENADIRALAALPPTTVFAPVDVSPDLLAASRHRAVAGGYHRNADAIGRVFRGFMDAPADAERIVRASGATVLAACPLLNETELYKRVAPQGLWARLERGERVAWLRPLPVPGGRVLAWAVRPLPEARPDR